MESWVQERWKFPHLFFAILHSLIDVNVHLLQMQIH
jgi:hypothetical protein